MPNWGIDTIGGLEAAFPNTVRVMGGTSPNVDNMILSSISVHIGATASNNFRLALYSGGTLSTGPDGATLLWDAGLTTVAANSWVTITYSGTEIVIPKNTALWLPWKGNDAVTTFTYSNTARGNFQTGLGRYNSIAVSTDETVAYPSTWPADTGTFADFWYDIYISYLVNIAGYGIRFRAVEQDYLTSSPTTFAAPANSSISFWLYLIELPGVGLFSRVLGTSGTYEVRISETGVMSNDMFQGTGFVDSITELQLDTPYHIVCTRASDNSAQIFINGLLDNSGSSNDGSAPAGVIEIGTRPGAADYIDGLLEDVRFYDRVLSLAEVQTISACEGTDNITYGLTHRWAMNVLPQGTRSSGSGVVKDIAGGSSQINLTTASVLGSGPEFTGNRIRAKRFT